uniref:SAICAR synthetase/ADE2 N-terminal domain-containing protein n=1 Tax=Strigamia maritima TaxID=126957 RepID=T1JIS6_STRMM
MLNTLTVCYGQPDDSQPNGHSTKRQCTRFVSSQKVSKIKITRRAVFSDIGVNTHFIKQVSDTEFIAKECAMILIEWISRRNCNWFDDANHDPQWTVEQLNSAKLEIGGVVIWNLDLMKLNI